MKHESHLRFLVTTWALSRLAYGDLYAETWAKKISAQLDFTSTFSFARND